MLCTNTHSRGGSEGTLHDRLLGGMDRAIYKQTTGVATGSPFSAQLAEVFLLYKTWEYSHARCTFSLCALSG